MIDPMAEKMLLISAGLFWCALLIRAFKNQRFTGIYEKICFIVFTAGLVLYIQASESASGRWPISWLLLTWCINAAQIINELLYNSRHAAWFASLWSAVALSAKITSDQNSIGRVFTRDMEWLNFHRLCFLLAYAFCLLVIPLAILTIRRKLVNGDETTDEAWTEDRMQYRMVLWALPLLTIGFLIEALFLLETRELPGPVQIWTESKETFLALGTWFFCGIYLHMRMIYAWKGAKIAALFLIGVALILAGHLSKDFLQFSAALH